MPMTIVNQNGYLYSYKNKPEKIKNEKYNTDLEEPYVQEFIKGFISMHIYLYITNFYYYYYYYYYFFFNINFYFIIIIFFKYKLLFHN